MQKENLPQLLENVEELVGQYVEMRSLVRFGPNPTDVDDLLEFRGYAPRDPSSTPGRALFAVGETLKAIGGLSLLLQVRDAYEAEYGPERTATLSAEWDRLLKAAATGPARAD